MKDPELNHDHPTPFHVVFEDRGKKFTRCVYRSHLASDFVPLGRAKKRCPSCGAILGKPQSSAWNEPIEKENP